MYIFLLHFRDKCHIFMNYTTFFSFCHAKNADATVSCEELKLCRWIFLIVFAILKAEKGAFL